MAFDPKFVITNKMTSAITQIERVRGFLEAATISEQWVDRMRSRALLLEAHYTTHIEGTQLTLEQSEHIWNGQDVAGANPDDKRELLNYRNAFDLVSEYLDGLAPITESLIREIHRRLVEGVRGGEGHPGEYRKMQNYVVRGGSGEILYTPPPPGDVPPLMQELVTWLKQEGSNVPPLIMGGIAQFQLVHIHPFVDGNGRASRLLSTLCLYRAGYDFKRLFTISEFYDRDRAAFYQAIQSVRKNMMDMTGWLEYYLTGLSTQMEEVKQRGSQAIHADILARDHGLNERQTLALEHLLTHGRLTIVELERLCPQTNRRSLQRDLKMLLKKGLILELGAGPTDPTRHYRLT